MTTQAKGRGRFEDATLLTLKMKWLRAMTAALEAGNDKETDYSSEPPKVVEPSWF